MVQRFWDAQAFTAGVARTFRMTWTVPANQALGTYRVDVGVFRVGWAELFHWNSGATSFAVTAGTPTTTTTTTVPPVTTTAADDEHDDHHRGPDDHHHVRPTTAAPTTAPPDDRRRRPAASTTLPPGSPLP